jgi:Tfp pilus assembly protein PilO
VKKKLAKLDMRVQMAAAAGVVLLFAIAGYMLLVSPQNAKAAKVQKQIADTQTQIMKKRAELAAGSHPPQIQTADLFKLARAMPDREDMPGIILALSQVARAAGISFDLIEPSLGTAPLAAGSYQVERIHLLFTGDFYGLSDFLYRLRNLVDVRHGQLDATGRLFNVDTVTFTSKPDQFPLVSAELYVDAYVYSGGASTTPGASTATPTATTPSTTTTTTTTTPTDTTSTSGDATAVGATG